MVSSYSSVFRLRLTHLVLAGYYDVMRDLFDYRTPSSDLISEQLKAPTYQAESFMKAIVRPLTMLGQAASALPEYQADITRTE